MSRIRRPQRPFVYHLALGLAGAVATLVAGGLSWTAGILVLVMVLANVGLGLQLTARQQAMPQSIDDYLAGQQQFSAQVAPDWSGHIESSREQMQSTMFSQAQCISGSTILGSGEVALILDVPALVRQARHGKSEARGAAIAA